MPIYFFDSSALVKRYIDEDGTTWVRAITDSTASNTIYLAEISGVEILAAITKRQRMGVKSGGISSRDATTAIRLFRDDFARQYQIMGVTSPLISHAMDLTEKHKLRAYDAVQLAVALDIDSKNKILAANSPMSSIVPTLTVVSSDDDLNIASIAEGLSLEDPRNYP